MEDFVKCYESLLQQGANRLKYIAGMTARDAYEQSDADTRRAYLSRLEAAGPLGEVAADIFRCQKVAASRPRWGTRTKLANEKKAIAELCRRLTNGPVLKWGWKNVRKAGSAIWVLCVDLPRGQVSFQAQKRGEGPDYQGYWDQRPKNKECILKFCDRVSPPRFKKGGGPRA